MSSDFEIAIGYGVIRFILGVAAGFCFIKSIESFVLGSARWRKK